MENIDAHFDFLIDQTEKMKTHYQNEDIKTILFFCLGLFDRLNEGLHGLKVLVQNMHATPALEFSAALTIRTLLSDFIIALNCYHIQSQSTENSKTALNIEKELDDFCN